MMEKQSYRPSESIKKDEGYYAEFEVVQNESSELSGPVAKMMTYAEMYRMPGDPELTKNDFVRFEKSNNRLQKDLVEKNKKIPDFGVWLGTDFALNSGDKVVERTVFEQKLNSASVNNQLNAIADFAYLSADLREMLSKKAESVIIKYLNKPERIMVSEVRTLMSAAQKISPSVEKAVRSKVDTQLFETEKQPSLLNSSVLTYELLPFASEFVQLRLVEKILEVYKKDIDYLMRACAVLKDGAQDSGVFKIIQRSLYDKVQALLSVPKEKISRDSKLPGGIMIAIEAIKHTPEDGRHLLYQEALQYPSSAVRLQTVREIADLPAEERRLLMGQAADVLYKLIKTENIRTLDVVNAFAMVLKIDRVYQEKFLPLIPEVVSASLKVGYNVHNNFLFAQLIRLLPRQEQEKIWPLLVQNTEELVSGKFSRVSDYTRADAAELLGYVPQTMRNKLEETLVASAASVEKPYENVGVKNLLASFPSETQGQILEKMAAAGKVDITQVKQQASTTPLYAYQPEHFFKKSFEKTGSGTTLLDKVPGAPEKSLKERVILRHIIPEAYYAWKKMYEDVDFWRQQGFDYVPVEPIVSAQLDPQKSLITVASRVLRGPSVTSWQKEGPALFEKHIRKQRQAIERAMKKFGHEHGLGHVHDGNFVLVFERSVEGDVLLDRPPKVYLIDFDQAVSVKQ